MAEGILGGIVGKDEDKPEVETPEATAGPAKLWQAKFSTNSAVCRMPPAPALAKQGNAKEALVKYDEALKYAPNWKQLKESRDAIVGKKS